MSILSIIWEMTPVCPLNCPICCMGAKTACSNAADEIEYGLKYAIVGQLHQLAAERDIKIDLSGGEIMTDLRNLDIAAEISKIIGKENVGISTSGYRIDADIANRLAPIIGEIELTMDTPPGIPYRLRPLEYAQSAARAVPLLKNSIFTQVFRPYLPEATAIKKIWVHYIAGSAKIMLTSGVSCGFILLDVEQISRRNALMMRSLYGSSVSYKFLICRIRPH